MADHASPRIPLLDLDLLRTLEAIAEAGSFSGAALTVHRTPSAISMQVKKMEEIVGRPLFARDSRSVSLTDDGAWLLAHARRMLALNREALARFLTPDLNGTVRLGATDDVVERLLPPMLRRFAETHPGVSVTVSVQGSDILKRQVAQGALDLVLVTVHQGQTPVEGLEELYRERLVWAGVAGGVAAERDPIPISVWEEGCVWRDTGLRSLEGAGRAWRIAFESAHLSGQRAAVLADLAVAPIPVSALGGAVIAAPGLPALPDYAIAMKLAADAPAPARAAADHFRASFASCCA